MIPGQGPLDVHGRNLFLEHGDATHTARGGAFLLWPLVTTVVLYGSDGTAYLWRCTLLAPCEPKALFGGLSQLQNDSLAVSSHGLRCQLMVPYRHLVNTRTSRKKDMSSETLSSLEVAILVRKKRRAQHLAEGYPELNSACTCTPRLLFSHCTGGTNISLQPNLLLQGSSSA